MNSAASKYFIPASHLRGVLFFFSPTITPPRNSMNRRVLLSSWIPSRIFRAVVPNAKFHAAIATFFPQLRDIYSRSFFLDLAVSCEQIAKKYPLSRTSSLIIKPAPAWGNVNHRRNSTYVRAVTRPRRIFAFLFFRYFSPTYPAIVIPSRTDSATIFSVKFYEIKV